MKGGNRNPAVSIHDRKAIGKNLMHTLKVVNAVRTMKGMVSDLIDEAKAFARAERRYLKMYGATSKYKPHQGAQECARRAEQLKKGQIYHHFN